MSETVRDEATERERAETLIEVRNLRTYYDEGGLLSGPPVKAVDGVSLDIRRGETLGLVGESGCGKTTFGRTLVRLESASGGTIRSDGVDVTSLSGRRLREWQRDAQLVFQDPQESLNDRMTVGEIVREPLEAHGWPDLTAAVRGADVEASGPGVRPAGPDERPDLSVDVNGAETTVQVRDGMPFGPDGVAVEHGRESVTVEVAYSKAELRRGRVFDLLDAVGLREEHYFRYPHQFSGGQRQRVGIARALALEPEFVVLDEPVSALDVSVQARIINLLDDLQDELELTYLFIAHDLSVVRHICDRVAVMYLGNVVERGPTESLFEDPKHPYTQALLSAIPGSVAGADRERIQLRGTPPSPRYPPAGCPFTTRCPAKIRPEGFELSERAWAAVETFRTVLRERARAETPVTERIRRLLGVDGTAADVEELVDEAFAGVALPADAQSELDRAVELAADGADREAADHLREAFGSVCDREYPEQFDIGEGRTSRCLRHREEYRDPATVVAERTRRLEADRG